MKTIYRLSFLAVVVVICLNCHKKLPKSLTNTGCFVTSCPSYFGTTQKFTYDASMQMTNLQYDFGYPGYTTYLETIDASKVYSSYSNNGVQLEETYTFLGGTGNLYDGMPTSMTRTEKQTSPNASSPSFTDGPTTIYGFTYDSKKRLSLVTYYPSMDTSSVYATYSRQLYNIKLVLTYDDNNNVTNLVQSDIYRAGVYNVNSPSLSYFYYDSIPWTIINVTYDAKPSPFSNSLKYWKFVQNDWGLASNTNWQAIVTALSPNNPLSMTWELSQGNSSSQKYTMTYNYNDRGYPADSYTYDCN